MATTAQEVFNITMALIDEILNDGTISVSDTVTYNVKTPGLLTILQAELIKQGDVFSNYEISNKPFTNLLGDRSNYDIKEFTGTEYICSAAGSVKSYYFEVDKVGTVYVEDYNGSWNTLATVPTTNTPEGFTQYKGIVTPSSGATQSRLRFTGSYYYRSVNRALFAIPFALAADVPVYRPWVKHQMPTDFKSVNEIVDEYCDQYIKDANYKWEGRRDLYVSYYFSGNIRIVYRPTPNMITALTDPMQLDDTTCRKVVPYGLAAHLMLLKNPLTASFFNQRFEEMRRDSEKMPPSPTTQIQNLYGGFC